MITKKTINGVNFHLYKSNRYKTTNIEIAFSRKVEPEKLSGFALMLSMFDESSSKYKSYREQVIAKEELYNVISYINISRAGYLYTLSTFLDFINIEYIDEKDYLKDVLEYFHEMTCNHDFHNKKVFNRLKKDLILNIENSKEIPRLLAYKNATKLMDKSSLSSLDDTGTIEDLNKLTMDDIDKYYDDLINNSNIDVFIMGNTDTNKIMDEFIKIFDLKGKNEHIDYEYFNKVKDTPVYKEDPSTFNQTVLNVIYNTVDFTKDENEFVFPVFNYIFGAGGLSAKLYKHVREENSLCYGIGSRRRNEDNIMVVSSDLKYENVKKGVELIDLSLEEMKDGKFTEEDIINAKEAIKTSINLSKSDPHSIIDNYKQQIFFDRHSLEEKEKHLLSVTKEEIMNMANKIKKNTTYVLCEAKDERN